MDNTTKEKCLDSIYQLLNTIPEELECSNKGYPCSDCAFGVLQDANDYHHCALDIVLNGFDGIFNS